MMKLNVAYLRVSTESQTEKYGLDLQKQKIDEYCEKNDVTINRWYIDGGHSGSKLDRPDMQRLLEDSQKGEIANVYVYKLDRLSRDTADTLDLMYKVLPKYGVKVISMTEDIRTENPMDRVMLTMNAAMNQYEREVIRMRMSAGMVERVKRGLWMGGGRIPYGYYYDRNDGILHIDEEQAIKVRMAYRMYLDGKSCDYISKALGYKGERIVDNILRRKSNIGYIVYNGVTYKGLHEPIIDEQTFYDVQKLMKKRSTNAHLANANLLTGLCFCGVCGARMRYQKWGAYHKLVCYSHQTSKEYMRKSDDCDNVDPKARVIEEQVEECIKLFAISLNDDKEELTTNRKYFEQEISKTKSKIKKMYDTYFQTQSESLLELIKDEETRVKDLKEQLQVELDNEFQLKKKAIQEEQKQRVKSMVDIWDDLDTKTKNKVLKECVEKIVITQDNVNIYFTTY